MPQATPQDHKAPADGSYSFTVDGKTYKLPAVDEKAAADIPGEISYDAIMSPESQTAQIRLAFATLNACNPDPKVLAALKSLSTKDMLEHLGAWMGEAGGSSD
jgi:hypothetical protein